MNFKCLILVILVVVMDNISCLNRWIFYWMVGRSYLKK